MSSDSEGLDAARAAVDRRFAYLLGVPADVLRRPGFHRAPDTHPELKAYMRFAVHFLAVVPAGAERTAVLAAPGAICDRIHHARWDQAPPAQLNDLLLSAARSLDCEESYLCDVLVGTPGTLTLASIDDGVNEYPPGARAVDWSGLVLSNSYSIRGSGEDPSSPKSLFLPGHKQDPRAHSQALGESHLA